MRCSSVQGGAGRLQAIDCKAAEYKVDVWLVDEQAVATSTLLDSVSDLKLRTGLARSLLPLRSGGRKVSGLGEDAELLPSLDQCRIWRNA